MRTIRRAVAVMLAMIVAAGLFVAVPAASAGQSGASAQAVAAARGKLTDADKAKLELLKNLYKQIAETEKAIRAKVKAARAAGKDLTPYTADLKTAERYSVHRQISHGLMLTEAERQQLEAMDTSIRSLERQLLQLRKAKAPQATIDALKAQIKAVRSARDAFAKSIRTAALNQFSARLDLLVADANMKLAFLQSLLARLP